MQSDKRIFDDLSKFLNGVAGTVAGMGREAEAGFRERTREWVAGMDLVSREEFDAVKQMAATARAEAEELKARVVALEAALGKPKTAPKAAAKPAAKPASKPRAAPKK
jgi:BMFP domain-containing protein YqiC